MIHNNLTSPPPVGSRRYEAPLTELFDLSLEAVFCQSEPKFNQSDNEKLTVLNDEFAW